MSRFYYSGFELRKLRIKLNKTQGELAKIADCNTQFVSNWERGICMPPVSCYKAIEKLLERNEMILFRETLAAAAVKDFDSHFRDRFFSSRVTKTKGIY